jgi:tRNA A-37 threonylcarbamoyl transferase component Bud32
MPFMEVNPKYQSLLARLGLVRPDDVLAVRGPIISGHPGRNVTHMSLSPAGPPLAFLKREYIVSGRDRLGSALAGFGFVSRSRREGLVLKALDGHGGPEWIAFGEDGSGRAFVLIADSGGVELRRYLSEVRRPRLDAERDRRLLARSLGKTLARLHQEGFRHGDLYAKHVLVNPATRRVTFLDWQRGRLGCGNDWPSRLRDLAALDATLVEELAAPRERLVFLRAYLKGCVNAPAAAVVVRRVRELSAMLLRKRRVREVRCIPSAVEQSVLWLDGEALCVTPEFQAELGAGVPAWLRRPHGRGDGLVRTVVPLPGGRRGLLVWRRRRSLLGWLGSLVWPRPLLTPEVREAGLLFRRQRLGEPAPRLLAFGQRCRFPGHTESFLLTELPPTEQARRTA